MDEPDNVRYLQPRRKVVTAIQDVIAADRLEAGDRLPHERDLARRLDATLPEVRHALAILESMRVLHYSDERHVLSEHSGASVDRLVRVHMSLSGFGTNDLMSIRLELESTVAARAATDATPEDLDPLHGIVEAMSQRDIDIHHFGELDRAFHTCLARAGHNDLATLLLTSLGDAVQSEMHSGYGRMLRWPYTAARLAEEHHDILCAVEQGDPQRASQAVTVHIGRFYDLRAG
ncbi:MULTISPECIES: FadR/GntR family transcriptional regulator [Prauserella salsuginis group]|uniref:FadR/GntR family transcriptional regulator n=1 Tax=Prauserella salsuginis TaxID=387889 RepID=A0ABW6G687_9PSEU|nr:MULTISPECIES: FCD domain-containing protein [Prauserella salsuginis group]MCR3719303.1 DNA-binding transcriptional regulator, FadR family [Prauserella flava]MCR3735684.1 DNA-binding transcriptional regulator, FadR family [Prauserella salsuginis]